MFNSIANASQASSNLANAITVSHKLADMLSSSRSCRISSS